MNVLQEKFDALTNVWHDGYGAEVKRSAVAFLLLIGLSFGVCLAVPSLRQWLADQILSLFSSLELTDVSGAISPLALFSNNLQACLITMFYGFLPFLQLPALTLGMNAIVLGGLAAYYTASGYSLWLYLLGLLPHGIFELPALVLSFAMGLYVCGQISRRIRKDAAAHSLWDCLAIVGWLTFLVLIPLLAVSAVVEAYITPLLLSLFL